MATLKQSLYNLVKVNEAIKDHTKNLMFYQELGVLENATQDEINKAYREQLIKCHPNKLHQQLGLNENTSQDEIKSIYRKKSLLLHPDRNVNLDEATRKEKEEQFKIIAKAYEFLASEDTEKICKLALEDYKNLNDQYTNVNHFKIISRAYQVLSNEDTRKELDEKLDTWRKIGVTCIVLYPVINVGIIGTKLYVGYKAISYGWYAATSLVAGFVGLFI